MGRRPVEVGSRGTVRKAVASAETCARERSSSGSSPRGRRGRTEPPDPNTLYMSSLGFSAMAWLLSPLLSLPSLRFHRAQPSWTLARSTMLRRELDDARLPLRPAAGPGGDDGIESYDTGSPEMSGAVDMAVRRALSNGEGGWEVGGRLPAGREEGARGSSSVKSSSQAAVAVSAGGRRV